MQEQSNTKYKYARWQGEKYWVQHKDKEKRRCAVTINYGDNQKCNKHDCNKRGLEK